ncbi:major facilitator superfamily MFS_1 [Staphylothermus marinus F1]|uniref:Major facilitator superfamily MFS_1 n=1 Tax=Staphylothermus marinus (strain ATCC 43588 / DSM 3639 / JCM 9404 / F1) TaxID=399550 RepID=A3DMF3_STAMF|nr:MFS transporter [Staphylothermus marinus]ABN69813.1 major facilitator superfamily MFS_1 [Staphylothermus marinus F1]
MSEERISSLKALLYGYGNLMGVGSALIVQWLLYYYSPPENSGLMPLAPIIAMGAVILFGRIVDAVSDPLIGYWSDKTISKWGRRKPFIVMGFILMALSQILIWIPIVHGVSIINVLYAAILLGVFWFGFTAAIAPYLALLPEIATTKEDRVKLSTFQAFFSQVSLIISGVIVPILLGILGFLNTAIVLTLIGITAMFSIVLGVKERIRSVEKIATKMNLWEAVKITATNKTFLLYLVPTALLVLSTTMLQTALSYAVTVSAGLEKEHVSLFYLPLIIVSIITLPIYKHLASTIGKKKVYLLGMLLFLIPTLMIAFIGYVPIDPQIYLLITGVIAGAFVTPLLMLPNAIIADITDVDEQITGYRREAIYFGTQGLITKTMAGIAGVTVSFLLGVFGYAPGNDLGIRLVYVVGALLLIPAALIFTKYPIEK